MLAAVRFVSQAELKELERKKAEEQLGREKAQADVDEERRKKRREKKEERRRQEESGELTWLAPGVERRFGFEKSEEAKRRVDSDDESRRSKKNRAKHDEASVEESLKKKEEGRKDAETDLEEKRADEKGCLTREDAGLDWMTRPALPGSKPSDAAKNSDDVTNLPGQETKPPSSSKELNPYWKTGGEGLPPDQQRAAQHKRTVGIGDGGASWRLKALKRAQEAATREGKNLNEVVEERWDSLGQLAASVASGRAAPANAHRFAQKNRERRDGEASKSNSDAQKNREGKDGEGSKSNGADRRLEGDKLSAGGYDRRPGDEREHRRPEGDKLSADRRPGDERVYRRPEKDNLSAGGVDKRPGDKRPEGDKLSMENRKEDRGYLRDVKSDKSQMQRPSGGGSLSWRSRERVRPMREADAAVMRVAAAAMNQFPDDGSFMEKFKKEAEKDDGPQKVEEQRGEQKREVAQHRKSVHERLGKKDDTAGKSALDEDRVALSPQSQEAIQQRKSVHERIEKKDDAASKSALDEERAALRGMVAALGESDQVEEKAPVSTSTVSVSQPQAGPSERGLSANQAPGLNANQLAAKAMRMKLMGKTAEAEELLKEAQKLRTVEVVTLPLVDSQGLAAPGAFGAEKIGGASERKQKRVQRYDSEPAEKERPKVKPRFNTERLEEESGSGSEEEKIPTGLGSLRPTSGPQRSRYYADDDAKDLKALVSETKRGRGGDYDSYLAENIVKNERFKGLANADAEYDHDEGLEMYESREKKGSQKKQAERFHSKQVADAKRLQSQQNQCLFCFDNPGKPKHLIVSIGAKVYMMLPPKGALVPGHCYIVTMAHEVASRNVDEDIWDEMRNFKKCLIKMWASEGKEVLFLETAVQLQKQKRHCTIEAIPVPAGVASRQGPLYFKKAIDEAESEWSQHNAKRIIDTRGKGLRASIPKGFPYFHVEFGLQGGYVHVIDDEAGWKASFGRDVVAGMLQLPEEDTRGRPKHQSFEQQRKAVLDFSKKWEPHDWTKMLG